MARSWPGRACAFRVCYFNFRTDSTFKSPGPVCREPRQSPSPRPERRNELRCPPPRGSNLGPFDARNHLQPPMAAGTGFDPDPEYPLQPLRPTHRHVTRCCGLIRAFRCVPPAPGHAPQRDRRSQTAVRGEPAVIAQQVHPRCAAPGHLVTCGRLSVTAMLPPPQPSRTTSATPFVPVGPACAPDQEREP